ncbi:MAG: hypothetical protein LBU72_02955 [Burkholderiaceae bacterium]|nr:hypothetical protein [Burkholderiaceae bacterium]
MKTIFATATIVPKLAGPERQDSPSKAWSDKNTLHCCTFETPTCIGQRGINQSRKGHRKKASLRLAF